VEAAELRQGAVSSATSASTWIHPEPPLDPTAVEKGERFLESLRAFMKKHVDPLQIERDAKIPDYVLEGLKGLGALGMKVPEQYGGVGLSQVYYTRALALPPARTPRSRPCSRRTSRLGSPSR
jgi:alkylation response protein AidB-like acyl-CoA dehydrogenase